MNEEIDPSNFCREGLREGKVNTVTISRDYGLTFEELAPLPNPDQFGRVWIIDENTVIYKSNMRQPIWILDLDSNEWRTGANLKYHRGNAQIGLVTRPSGEKEIVFVGGNLDVDGHLHTADNAPCKATCGWKVSRTVEIYNIANDTFRMGLYFIRI